MTLAVTAQAIEQEETGWIELEYDLLEMMSAEEVSLQGVTGTFENTDTTYRDQMARMTDTMFLEVYDAVAAAMETRNFQTEEGAIYLYTEMIDVGVISGEDSEEVKNNIQSFFNDRMIGGLAAYDNDHPFETSITNGSVGIQYSRRTLTGETSIGLYLEILPEPEEKLDALTAAVEEFLFYFMADGLDEQPALTQYRFIQYYLGDRLSYNYGLIEDQPIIDANFTAEQQEHGHNAFGALVGLDMTEAGLNMQGQVVCQGYADAYLLLCQAVDLPCVVVIGEGEGSGEFTGYSNHMWNAIKLNETWYALDATWDDIDNSIVVNESRPEVLVSTVTDKYFTDNRYFLAQPEGGDIKRDHVAYSQCNYGDVSFTLAAPMLDNVRLAETDAGMATLTVTLQAEEETPAIFADVLAVIGSYGANGTGFSDISDVYIWVPAYAEFSSTCAVPEGHAYSLLTYGENQAALTRAEGFTRELFYVSENGILDMYDMYLTGEGENGRTATAPLLTGASGSAVGMSNVIITDNLGAAGFQTDGWLVLNGLSCVSGNRLTNGSPVNLALGPNASVDVISALAEGYYIGVTAALDSYGTIAPLDYAWTAADRAVFVSDDDTTTLRYVPHQDCLLWSDVWTTDPEMPAQFTGFYVPATDFLSGQAVVLSGQTVGTKVLVACYDTGTVDRLCSTCVLTVGEGGTVTLPEIPEGTEKVTIFALNGSIPMAAAWSVEMMETSA